MCTSAGKATEEQLWSQITDNLELDKKYDKFLLNPANVLDKEVFLVCVDM
jgi:hypothetical protein